MQKNVLLVDDSEESQTFVRSALNGSHISLSTANTLREARERMVSLDRPIPDLIVLDRGLPDGDGMDLFREIREDHRTQGIPIFFLTAKDDLDSKVSAFDLGAEEYLVKPLHARELSARIRMKLRNEAPSVSPIVRHGDIVIDLEHMQARLEGRSPALLDLTGKELRILLLISRTPGHVFSRADIVREVWGTSIKVLDRTVDSHICGLRRKLAHCSNYIESVPGSGYRFAVRSID